MQLSDLDFQYPSRLVATEPQSQTRVAFVPPIGEPTELNLEQLLSKFAPDDLLVINDSKVIPARVFAEDGTEILFLRAAGENEWQTLFPAREFKVGEVIALPGGLEMTLREKGLPQLVRVSEPLTAAYFEAHGEMALPPYIQEARGERHSREEDRRWYQTEWARKLGSVAAPTASLHFKNRHLEKLLSRGVRIESVTLHVGAGTFLPVKTSKLEEHQMHFEWSEIPVSTMDEIKRARAQKKRVWALGTTVARTLESSAQGMLDALPDGRLHGATNLFIYPPYRYQVVNALLTNFHQPRSTLFALVAAFAGLERAREVYAWAIAREFKLFSYGDLSAWIRG